MVTATLAGGGGAPEGAGLTMAAEVFDGEELLCGAQAAPRAGKPGAG